MQSDRTDRDSLQRNLMLAFFSALLMALMIWVVFKVNIPNPNMILITVLVVITAVCGPVSGAVAAAMMILYSMYFFSADHSFFRYGEVDAQKMIVVVIGVVLCYLSVAFLQDTRTRSQRMLQQKHDSLDSLLTHMPGLAFLKDARTGVYIACNQEFAEYAHKRDPDGVVGLTDHEIFDKKTADHFVEDDRITVSMDRPYVFYEDVPDAAGRDIRNLQTTKLKFTDTQGRLCVLGMCVDITQTVRMKRENLEARQAYEQARSDSLTYSAIAQALSADYDYLYCVSLKTEESVEYYTDNEAQGALAEKRRIAHFFEASRADAQDQIATDDVERFTEAFTKENMSRILDEQGTFILNYRLIENGVPVHVSMKASRMLNDPDRVIIGVTNIDTQVSQEEEWERVREERITYSRISALSGDYICIYTVDPDTGHYTEYSATKEYTTLGLSTEGEDFFEKAASDAGTAVWHEDINRFRILFTRENVLREIEQNGFFSLQYRLVLGGAPVYVNVKAAFVEEKSGRRLIVGVSNVDSQVRRDQEYEYNLAEARKKASRDALTGLKNKHAWDEAVQQLDRQIAEGTAPKFAVVVFDLNGLKNVNDSRGHQAGDVYLKEAGAVICDLFKHSPVFRIGGDEFTAFSQGRDYERIDALLDELMRLNRQNIHTGGPVIAAGMARFEKDPDMDAVFARADSSMYRNKKELSALGAVSR